MMRVRRFIRIRWCDLGGVSMIFGVIGSEHRMKFSRYPLCIAFGFSN